MAGRAHSDRVSLPVRLMGLLLAGAYGLVALATGFDRAGADRPDLIPLIPAGLRGASLEVSGADALRHGRAKQARQWATLAVDAAPMEAGSTGLLGSARQLAGDAAGADTAFRVAASRGWREPRALSYWLQRSLELGDYPAAATRLDALLRQQTYLVRDRDTMDPFEANPAAVAALVERIETRPFWLGPYVGDVVDLPVEQLQNRAGVLLQLAASGTRLGCATVAPLTAQLVRRNLAALANQLWTRHCDGQGAVLVRDGNLAHVEADSAGNSPFAWQVLASGDVRVVPGEGAFAGLLQIANSAAFARPVLRQMIVAPAGRYRLTWLARREDGTSAAAMAPYFGCDFDSPARVEGLQDLGKGHWQADVTLDGQCAGRWLRFSITPGAQAVGFGKIGLVPLAGQ